MPQASESRNSRKNNPRKKKQHAFMIKLKGLGCKGTSLTASAPELVRSASDLENRKRNRKMKTKNKQMQVQRYPRNVVIDVPDHVCCAPPGIGINASDVVPRKRNRNIVPRNDERKITSVARRNRDNPVPDITEVLSRNIRSRGHHRSAIQIIEMLMLQQDLVSGRVIRGYDRHQDWRLNADDMTYEELADLSDKIGYVGSGLREEEILNCLRISKDLNASFTISDEDWKCSICQEICRRNEDIGALNCGHHHHLQCLKHWLHHKNECPICKAAAIAKS